MESTLQSSPEVYQGPMCTHMKDTFQVSSVRVGVIDKTGAGDGFRPRLIAGMLEAIPLQDCLKLASAVLGLRCCYYGGCVCGGGLDSVLEAAPLA